MRSWLRAVTVRAVEYVARAWCHDCWHFCTDRCTCAAEGHRYRWEEPL